VSIYAGKFGDDEQIISQLRKPFTFALFINNKWEFEHQKLGFLHLFEPNALIIPWRKEH
jgi:hypothetical protein